MWKLVLVLLITLLIAQLVADAPVIQAGVGVASQRQIQVTYGGVRG
jgi:hypothetical protein